MTTRVQKLSFGFIVLLALGLGVAEVGLRSVGVIDFPVYDTDSEIGYIPRASQNGKFLNKSTWIVNETNMGTEAKWQPGSTGNILLLGDSIVWGGNPVDQKDKLGPQLQSLMPDSKVWPVSAGSWSVENPQVWMHRHPDVVSGIQTLVWVVNSGDFAPASKWSNELTHPRTRPSSALVFVAKKYLLPKLGLKNTPKESTGSENKLNPDIARHWAKELELLEGRQIRTVVVLYPTKTQLLNKQEFAEFADISKEALTTSVELVELSQVPTWDASFYRDEIHPNTKGYRHLANLIAECLKQPQSN